MTTDIDTFAEWFDDSSRAAHKRTSRTDQPSARVWQEVSAQVTRPSYAQPISQAYSYGERTDTMNAIPSSPVRVATPTPSRSIPAWIAAGVVLMLIASGFYLNTLRPGDGGNRLAWAPGTAVPASPSANTACAVEPLTTEEVMDTIHNPMRGYARLGYDDGGIGQADAYLEVTVAGASTWMPSSALSPVTNLALEAELEAFATTFWSCLEQGTFGQVWAMLDPVLLQWSILSQFPVIRTEEALSEFVERWINTPYNQFLSDGTYVYTLPPAFAGRSVEVVNAEDHPILASQREAQANSTVRYASISLRATNPADIVDYFTLNLTQHPDGSWTVAWVYEIQKQTPGMG